MASQKDRASLKTPHRALARDEHRQLAGAYQKAVMPTSPRVAILLPVTRLSKVLIALPAIR